MTGGALLWLASSGLRHGLDLSALYRPAFGGPEVAPGAPAAGTDVVMGPIFVLAAIVAFFALLGFRGGVRRQALTLFLTALTYWITTTHWPTLAARLPPVGPVSGSWLQAATFGGGVLVSHLFGRRLVSAPTAAGAKLVQSLPGLLERLMGLILGGANGYLVGRFSLLRLPAGAVIRVGPQPDVQAIVEHQAPNVLWAVIGVIILFGVMSLQPKKKDG